MVDPIEFLLPGAVYLFLVLAALAVHAFLPGRPRAWRRWRFLLAGLALWAWVLSAPVFANLALVALEGDPRAAQPAIATGGEEALVVVLGSGRLFAFDGRPAPRLDANGWERLRAGIALWRRTGGKILFTGGPGPDDSLAGQMKAIAVEAGVPPGAVLVATRSRTTYEDLVESREAIDRHRGRAWLVTSAAHMPRALAVARKLGLALEPHPCAWRQLETPTWRAWLPDNGGPAAWSVAIHEFAGRQYYRLRGWAD